MNHWRRLSLLPVALISCIFAVGCLPSGPRSVSSREQLFRVLDIATGTDLLALKAAQPATAGDTLPQQLPVELEGDLSNPRIAGIADSAEGRTADIPTRIDELRVVEDVEELKTQIEGEIVLDLRVL